MDIPLFSEPPYFMNDGLPPDAFISKRVLSETMTFLFAMEKQKPLAQKHDLRFLIFFKRCII